MALLEDVARGLGHVYDPRMLKESKVIIRWEINFFLTPHIHG